MGIAKIKEKLIDQINAIDDNKLLEEIYELVRLEKELKEEEVFILSKEKEASLLKTYQDVKSGNYLTSDQANEEASKWLK